MPNPLSDMRKDPSIGTFSNILAEDDPETGESFRDQQKVTRAGFAPPSKSKYFDSGTEKGNFSSGLEDLRDDKSAEEQQTQKPFSQIEISKIIDPASIPEKQLESSLFYPEEPKELFDVNKSAARNIEVDPDQPLEIPPLSSPGLTRGTSAGSARIHLPITLDVVDFFEPVSFISDEPIASEIEIDLEDSEEIDLYTSFPRIELDLKGLERIEVPLESNLENFVNSGLDSPASEVAQEFSGSGPSKTAVKVDSGKPLSAPSKKGSGNWLIYAIGAVVVLALCIAAFYLLRDRGYVNIGFQKAQYAQVLSNSNPRADPQSDLTKRPISVGFAEQNLRDRF